MKSVFEVADYKAFISLKLAENKQDRSYRSKLVEQMGCQLSFFSQVMHSHVHITPDHAASLAEFWGLNPEETTYFLDLVLLERAGSPALKKMIGSRLKETAEKSSNVSEKFKNQKRIQSPEALAYYYGSWHVPAIHMIVSIEKFKTAFSIAEHLRIPLRNVEEALRKLMDFGLIKPKKGGGWDVTDSQIHLNSGTPIQSAHMINWLTRAIANIQSRDASSHNFAIYCTMSEKDFEKLKREMSNVVDKFTREIITPSKPEVLVCMNTNIFKT